MMAPSLLALGFSTSPVTGAVSFLTSQHFAAAVEASVFGWITGVQPGAGGLGAAISGLLLERDADTAVAIIVALSLTALAALVGSDPRGTFSAQTHRGVLV